MVDVDYRALVFYILDFSGESLNEMGSGLNTGGWCDFMRPYSTKIVVYNHGKRWECILVNRFNNKVENWMKFESSMHGICLLTKCECFRISRKNWERLQKCCSIDFCPPYSDIFSSKANVSPKIVNRILWSHGVKEARSYACVEKKIYRQQKLFYPHNRCLVVFLLLENTTYFNISSSQMYRL